MKHIEIGHVIKAHGLKGEMKVLVKGIRKKILNQSEAVFLGKSGQLEPYFVEYLKGNEPLILKLEEIDSKEAVHSFIKSSIFVQQKEEWLSWLDAEKHEDGYNHLIGYAIQDDQIEKPLEIVAIEAFPQQTMAFVLFGDKEIPIPLNETYILEIDHDSQCIRTDLPIGMIE